MTVSVNICPTPILQFFNNAGQPAVGGTVLTQVGGVNATTYQDPAGTIALPNPIPLNSRGEASNASGVSCQVFLQSGVTYVFTLFDANGNQLNQAQYMTSTVGISAVALAASSGSSLIGYIATGTGAVARTLQAHERDWVSVLDFGADNTGASDSATAFQNAINSLSVNAVTPAGGTVWVPPGLYVIGSPLVITGVKLQGTCAIGKGTFEATQINKTFNGNLFEFRQGGGGLSGLMVANLDNAGTPYTGAAIYAVSDGVNQTPGRVFIDDCDFSSTLGWERIVDIDGTLSSIGTRQWFFNNCLFFGVTTAGQTIRIKKGVHCIFVGCDMITAPTVITPGLRVENSFSTDIHWIGGKNEGTIYTEAAGNNVTSQVGVLFYGALSQGITCAAGSARNLFLGFVDQSSFTNSGDISNVKQSEQYNLVGSGGQPAFLNSWVNFGGTENTVGFRKDFTNQVTLRGSAKSGTIGASPMFILPAGYRPALTVRFAVASNAAFGQCVIDSGGNVYAFTGSNTQFNLDGIVFKAEA